MTATGWTATSLRSLAPEAFESFDLVLARLPGTAPDRLAELARRRITQLLAGELDQLDAVAALDDDSIDQLRSWPTSPMFDARDRACLELVEQFVIDVSAIDDEMRARTLGVLGDDAFGIVQAIYVLDHGLRVRAALRQIFGVEHGAAAPGPADREAPMWPALEDWMRAVARCTALDPVTTEIVRLRGARAHDCRRCRTLRNATAVAHGATEELLDRIDDPSSEQLSPMHRSALALVDAMLWQPSAIGDELAATVLEHFGPEGTVEIVLDVARNAANKIAVAFGADAPTFEMSATGPSGIELYDIDADGEPVYGTVG